MKLSTKKMIAAVIDDLTKAKKPSDEILEVVLIMIEKNKEMEIITEKEIESIGFDKIHSYPHNQYVTNQYRKGCLLVDFTYKVGEIEAIDVMVDTDSCADVSRYEIFILDKILNKK